MTKPCTFGRAFDQTGDVGDDEAAIEICANDTQLRMQRGERIVGDLGTCSRNRSD
jgi:hypothetical protein